MTGPGLVQSSPDRAATPLEEWLWLAEHVAGRSIYNVNIALRLVGDLRVSAVRASLASLIKRHPALRSRFYVEAGRPRRETGVPMELEVPVVDVPPGAESGRWSDALAKATVQSHWPFDLELAPLLRTTLFRLSETEHLLLVVVHHIVFDGWSRAIFLREFAAHYNAEVSGKRAGLPEPTSQEGGYAEWLREQLQGDRLKELLGFWRPSRNPIFQAMFSLDIPSQTGIELTGLTTEYMELPRDGSAVDLSLGVVSLGEKLRGSVEFEVELFKESTIERMTNHWVRLLAGAVEEPETHLPALPLLDGEERRAMLVDWSRTARPDSQRGRTVYELFEEHAERSPEAAAVLVNEQAVSY